MKLIYTPGSPFARKVRVVARECGHQLTEITEHPLAEGSAVPNYNPLGKVPALVLDDGQQWVDSPVLCEYLDQLGREPTLLPHAGPTRFEVLQRQALADGAMDAAVHMVMELRRPPQHRSPFWLQRWHDAIMRTLTMLERAAPSFADRLDLGVISTVCLLDYLDFRLAEVVTYRTQYPALVACLERNNALPSFRDTHPAPLAANRLKRT